MDDNFMDILAGIVIFCWSVDQINPVASFMLDKYSTMALPSVTDAWRGKQKRNSKRVTKIN